MSSVARVLLGVTGGIAAYKACEVVEEPMVPPRAPSFTQPTSLPLRGCRRAKPGSAAEHPATAGGRGGRC
jgi:hypothetical protein